MIPSLNYTNTYSRRRIGRFLDFLLEVLKTCITFALIIVMLSVAVWSFLGVNPLREWISR